MKLLSIASMAIAAVSAQSAGQVLENNSLDNRVVQDQVYIPFDCVNEINNIYGNSSGTLISDLEYIPGVPTSAQVCAITACTDTHTNMISGIQTVWSSGGSIIKTAKIGRLSGLVEFGDDAGKSGQVLESLEKYYYREADEDGEEYYNTVRNVSDGDYSTRLADAFEKADITRDQKLSFDEFQEFFWRVRMYPQEPSEVRFNDDVAGSRWTEGWSSLNYLERMFGAWEAATALGGDSSSISIANYSELDQIMATWFGNGKLDVAGSIYWRSLSGLSSTPTNPTPQIGGEHRLREVCKTWELDVEDRITRAYIKSSRAGIRELTFQSRRFPEVKMAEPTSTGDGSADYSFEDENWVSFQDGLQYFGLWGYEGANGDLNGLGFVGYDYQCIAQNGGGFTAWDAPWQENVVVVPDELLNDSGLTAAELQSEFAKGDAAGLGGSGAILVPNHDHDDDVEKGLVAVSIIIWILAAGLVGVLIYMMCQERKSAGRF